MTAPKPQKKKVTTRLIPSEDEECYAFAEWLTVNRYTFTHIANETYTPSWSVRKRNKKLGVSSGVPDYLVLVKGQLVWIEMKRSDLKPKRGGKGGVSEAQQGWMDALNKCANTQVFTCYGADEARSIIKSI